MEKNQTTAATLRTDGYTELLFNRPGVLTVIVLSPEELINLQNQIKDAADKQLEAIEDSVHN